MCPHYSNSQSSGYAGCKFCGGRGCLACPGQKRKTESAAIEAEAKRKADLAAKTPQEIINSLPSVRTGVRIAAGVLGKNLSEDEIERLARQQIVKDLEDGGHELPEPELLFSCDGSPTQIEEMVELFHIDRLREAAANPVGMEALTEKARQIMERRQNGQT